MLEKQRQDKNRRVALGLEFDYGDTNKANQKEKVDEDQRFKYL